MNYKEMLKKAKKELPPVAEKSERFEVPLAKGHIQGNRTIVSNFHQIASALRRDPEHLLKYILRELATPGELKSNELILGRKINPDTINEKIKDYVNKFVICRECKSPDTQLTKEDQISFLKCTACGAKRPIMSLI